MKKENKKIDTAHQSNLKRIERKFKALDKLIENAPYMLDHLIYIEHAISIHNLASLDDGQYIGIVITVKSAKELIKTIVEITT